MDIPVTAPKVATASTKLAPAGEGHRLRSLDAVRGLAALGTVIFHYVHFAPSSFPYDHALVVIYKEGWRLVDLFFLLSGFVFFMNYERVIAEGKITFSRFMLLRLTRLYPLHVLTLFVTAALQLWIFNRTGAFKIYSVNDLAHFILNLLLLQFGWLEQTYSFNGPSWSLSTEFFLYIVFFGACLVPKRFRPAIVVVLVLFGAMLVRHVMDTFLPLVNHNFGRGLVGFFLGGICHHLTTYLASRRNARRLTIALCIVFGAATLAVVWAVHAGNSRMQPFCGDVAILSTTFFFATICLSALIPIMGRFRPLTYLGDISYSVYLVHIPIQLAFFVYQSYSGPIDFSKSSVYWAFLFATVGVASISYPLFEVPAMRKLRALMPR